MKNSSLCLYRQKIKNKKTKKSETHNISIFLESNSSYSFSQSRKRRKKKNNNSFILKEVPINKCITIRDVTLYNPVKTINTHLEKAIKYIKLRFFSGISISGGQETASGEDICFITKKSRLRMQLIDSEVCVYIYIHPIMIHLDWGRGKESRL